MTTDKKYGGILTAWQLHTISTDIDRLKTMAPEINFKVDKVMIMTATVVQDPTHRWRSGTQIRTSLVVDISDDMVETLNTRYQIIGP